MKKTALALGASGLAALSVLALSSGPRARRGSEAQEERPEHFRREVLEPFIAAGERAMRAAAPFDTVAPGAHAAAVAAARKKPKTTGAWTPVGLSPLRADHPDYAGTDPVFSGPSRLGWVGLSGRVNALAGDPDRPDRVFLGAAAGGVWETTDGGATWTPIADALPTQAIGGLAFTRADGGTLIVGTGDRAIGGVVTPSGLGVYRRSDGSGAWTKATGVPDGLVTFRVAVDPTNASVNYVATNKGLYRSADNGRTYTNVALPIPKVAGGVTTPNGCANNLADPACTYAAVVTDVIVRPGTGAVMAAVGYPLGSRVTRYGISQAPQNGIYVSPSGLPGSFRFVDPGNATAPTLNGFTPTPYVGRTALAGAFGPGQNPDIVYALVQDARKMQNCVDTNALPAACTGTGYEVLAQATFLEGGYVSRDFGLTWTRILTAEQLRAPGTGSALELGILGYGPGIQSWYNNWIGVDPTATDPLTGAPTRVVFGLEEIWQNALPVPVLAPTSFKVIGRYWNACALVAAGIQCSEAGSPIPGTTTHPDQHAGLFVPDGLGGVTLFAGNDGGVYKQHVTRGEEFTSEGWGDGLNALHTLQPYDARAAKDGTIVFGAQDNGTVKISPDGRQDMIFGGDGFFVGIDPDDSRRIVEEYAYGAVYGSTDGGRTWTAYDPFLTSPLFSTPFEIDPGNADRMMIAGRDIAQTAYPYQVHCVDQTLTPEQCNALGFVVNTGAHYDNWSYVFDLGTVRTATGGTAPRQTTALDLRGDAAYVGYCAPCSVFSGVNGFESGIATNVGGAEPPAFGTPAGWRHATAAGLPDRYVTSVRIDPADPTRRTIYVTLGGYSSHWVPPGANGEDASRIGTGHVFVSTDAGETFTDVSGDLPDAPANWVLKRGTRLVVGTDVGVFISSDLSGGSYHRLGDLPAVPVLTVREDPADPNRLIAATFGRGVYSYRFKH